jgi:drug/metabolite transporter (DMT)-like permease
LRRSDLPWLVAVIVAGGLLGPLLLMRGLASSDAASASLLLNLEGLATMGIAWVVFRENVDRHLLLGAFAILAGALVLSWESRFVIRAQPALSWHCPHRCLFLTRALHRSRCGDHPAW